MFYFSGALLISSGFSLNLTVCALLVVKRAKDDEIPMNFTPQERRKSLMAWSGYYYFSHQLYCVDEDAEKREFFWNIKELVSIPACPVDYDDYKMDVNSRVPTSISEIDEITRNNTIKNSSIKDGVVLTVEGLNNEAYESSADNLENGHCVQFEIPNPKMDDTIYEISKDNSENPHYLQFEIPKTKTKDETYEMSKDDSENSSYLEFEMSKTTTKETTDETSKVDLANGHYLQFEVPKPKLNSDEVAEKTEDIENNKKTVQNGNKTKSANNDNKKVRIKFQKESIVQKSVKEKLKLLYTNVSFVLLLISLSLFLFGTSIVFTHILPYVESENVSSSIGLLLVSVLGGAGLAGKIGLGAIAQLPRVNAIVLYIIAVFLCGMFIYYSPQTNIDLRFVFVKGKLYKCHFIVLNV